MQVIAIQDFEHYGTRNPGDVFEVSDQHADKLKKSGLVRFNTGEDNPITAVGAKLSALPAAQALPQTIVKKSKRGKKPKMNAA